MSPRRLLRRVLPGLLWAAAFSPACLGQVTYKLDPQDVTSYAEWTRREYKIGVVRTQKYGAQLIDNSSKSVSVLPITGDAGSGSTFWSAHAPRWWSRMVTSWPFGSPTPAQQGEQRSITQLWDGLDTYQRARAVLRGYALMRQALGGLRFNLNAWSLLKQVVVLSEDSQVVQGINGPRGFVTLSVVPPNNDSFRAMAQAFGDDPKWDNGQFKNQIRMLGPRSWKDVAVGAEEVTLEKSILEDLDPDVNTPAARVESMLKGLEAGTKAAADTLARIRLGVAQRASQAANDAFSSRRLSQRIKEMQLRRMQAYKSVIGLRALIEGRSASAVAEEYKGTTDIAVREANSDLAKAELASEYYLEIAKTADNTVAPLLDLDREKGVVKLEEAYQGFFNDSSEVLGMLKDLDNEIKANAQVLTQLFPSIAPYVGDVLIPLDVALVVTGTANSAETDAANPTSDMQSMMRDAQARVLGIRMTYHLWEELRAVRQLAYLAEMQKVAGVGLVNERRAELEMIRASLNQQERQLSLLKLTLANNRFSEWKEKIKNGWPPETTP